MTTKHVPDLPSILLTDEVRLRWGEVDDPAYRHASIDILHDPAVHGRGIGRDAVRTLARHLVTTADTAASPSTRRRTTRR